MTKVVTLILKKERDHQQNLSDEPVHVCGSYRLAIAAFFVNMAKKKLFCSVATATKEFLMILS